MNEWMNDYCPKLVKWGREPGIQMASWVYFKEKD
jgi:hypothetical protein